MTIHVKPEDLIASQEIVLASAAPASGVQAVERPSQVYMRLLPILIFAIGMPLAAIPMMLG